MAFLNFIAWFWNIGIAIFLAVIFLFSIAVYMIKKKLINALKKEVREALHGINYIQDAIIEEIATFTIESYLLDCKGYGTDFWNIIYSYWTGRGMDTQPIAKLLLKVHTDFYASIMYANSLEIKNVLLEWFEKDLCTQDFLDNLKLCSLDFIVTCFSENAQNIKGIKEFITSLDAKSFFKSTIHLTYLQKENYLILGSPDLMQFNNLNLFSKDSLKVIKNQLFAAYEENAENAIYIFWATFEEKFFTAFNKHSNFDDACNYIKSLNEEKLIRLAQYWAESHFIFAIRDLKFLEYISENELNEQQWNYFEQQCKKNINIGKNYEQLFNPPSYSLASTSALSSLPLSKSNLFSDEKDGKNMSLSISKNNSTSEQLNLPSSSPK